jgi:hypothetical protein
MSEPESRYVGFAGQMNCGSCFFGLPIGAATLSEDQPASLGVELFYIKPSHPTTHVKGGIDLMRRSAERSCLSCAVMHKFLLSHLSTQDSINWIGMFDDGIIVYSGAVNPSPALDTVEVSSSSNISRPPRPPPITFDLFCLPDEWAHPISEFGKQRTRRIHPFLNIAAHPSGNTKSELAMARLTHWLIICLSSHTPCGNALLPGGILWLEDEGKFESS